MLHLARLKDPELIKAIVTDLRIYSRMSDDFAPKAEDYVPPSPEEAVYVGLWVDGVVKGLWALVPHSRILWEVHTALLPEVWGTVARDAAPELLKWVWENTECQRLYSLVPSYARATRKFALHAGMEECGTHEKAFLKDKELYDLTILGINRK